MVPVLIISMHGLHARSWGGGCWASWGGKLWSSLPGGKVSEGDTSKDMSVGMVSGASKGPSNKLFCLFFYNLECPPNRKLPSFQSTRPELRGGKSAVIRIQSAAIGDSRAWAYSILVRHWTVFLRTGKQEEARHAERHVDLTVFPDIQMVNS